MVKQIPYVHRATTAEVGVLAEDDCLGSFDEGASGIFTLVDSEPTSPIENLLPLGEGSMSTLLEVPEVVRYFAPLDHELDSGLLKKLEETYRVSYVMSCEAGQVATENTDPSAQPQDLHLSAVDENNLYRVAQLVFDGYQTSCIRGRRPVVLDTDQLFRRLRRHFRDGSSGIGFYKEGLPVAVLLIEPTKERPILGRATIHVSYFGIMPGRALSLVERRWILLQVAARLNEMSQQQGGIAISAAVEASDTDMLALLKRRQFAIKALRVDKKQ